MKYRYDFVVRLLIKCTYVWMYACIICINNTSMQSIEHITSIISRKLLPYTYIQQQNWISEVELEHELRLAVVDALIEAQATTSTDAVQLQAVSPSPSISPSLCPVCCVHGWALVCSSHFTTAVCVIYEVTASYICRKRYRSCETISYHSISQQPAPHNLSLLTWF